MKINFSQYNLRVSRQLYSTVDYPYNSENLTDVQYSTYVHRKRSYMRLLRVVTCGSSERVSQHTRATRKKPRASRTSQYMSSEMHKRDFR